MDIYSIYLITNLVNGKQYVGYTEKTPLERFDVHCQSAFRDSQSYFHKAIRKYGRKNFIVECLYQTNDKEHALEEMEEHFIREYNCHFKDGIGYNMTYGGQGGDNSQSPNFISSLEKRNISGENNWRYGKTFEYKPRPSRRGKKPANFKQWAKASKGKSYYHNVELQQEKRFLPSEVPQGWEKGRLKTECSCGKKVDISNFKKYHSNC